jgi:hypothetical protein
MAGEARELGLDYLGIADHSKSSFQANGLNEERLAEQIDLIADAQREEWRISMSSREARSTFSRTGGSIFPTTCWPARLRRRLGAQRHEPGRGGDDRARHPRDGK